MSRRQSTWNLAADRDAPGAEPSSSPPYLPRGGWLRTLLASIALFFVFFALLALRMRDGIDPAEVANAKSAKAKAAASPSVDGGGGVDGPEPSDTYGYGYDPYGSDSSSQGYQQYAPQPSTRAS